MTDLRNAVARAFARFMRSEDGVTATEYALLASLISVAALAGYQATSDSLVALSSIGAAR